METLTIELPTMYGDHHVLEVRRLLLALKGVTDAYASSGFRVVEVIYDPAEVGPEAITTILAEAGYAGELPMPVEASTAAYINDTGGSYFRHTAVYETVRQVVGFSQNIGYQGRPLWPCPGVGPIRTTQVEED